MLRYVVLGGGGLVALLMCIQAGCLHTLHGCWERMVAW